MKKIINNIKSNMRQLLEVGMLIIVTVVPFFVNLGEIFMDYLRGNILSPDNFVWYMAIKYGNYVASVIFFFIVLFAIRKFNSDYIMNRMHVYHEYCYLWYWFCAKVLGIRKCDLILVPIYMQFKLIIRGTFDEYPLDDDDYPIIDNEPECRVTIKNADASKSEINFILEDTYVIEDFQIPKSKRELFTLRISRNDGKDNGRHFSQKFIEAIINEIRKYKQISLVNIFATTNPKNTANIAKRAFALGDRGNIEHLYVFQQTKDGCRKFEGTGYKVY